MSPGNEERATAGLEPTLCVFGVFFAAEISIVPQEHRHPRSADGWDSLWNALFLRTKKQISGPLHF